MPSVTFEGVVKRFEAVTIVEEFTLEVADGELLVLVGGSGSGKSTILRMVAGLTPVSAGTIRIGTRDITALPPRDRDVAMVFQDYALYPHLTVRDNLSLGLRLRRVKREEIVRRVEWATGMLGLDPLLDRLPRQLSGGQRQRVAMGRAMVREPHVFLFDEPLSNLDAGLRAQLRIEVGGLQRRLHTTTIYVTHDQVEAMTLGDRIVVLAGGRIQQVGTPIELYRAPANRFVAGFIGTPPMNFMEGRLGEVNGRPSAISEESHVALPSSRMPTVPLGALTIGIRPEDLRIVPPDEAAARRDDCALTGRVALVERLGGTSHVHVDVGATRMLVLLRGEPLPSVDDTVCLHAPLAAVHVFADDGRALTSGTLAPGPA